MNLEEMISELISDGYSPLEAAKVAAAAQRAEKMQTSLAKEQADLNLSPSVQNDGRPAVDYGDESPAEARARWEEQERQDPQGIYSGGMTQGGVFGSGPIATDNYDPEALNRTMGMQERVQNQQVQLEMLRTMKQLQAAQRPVEPERRLSRGQSFRQLLGKKKR